MSSCSCQHLLIACNSSLRVTAGAAGLGPAPPAIACTHSQSWPGQGLPSPPPRSWGSQLSQGFPGQTPGQRCPLLLSPGQLRWGLCGASPQSPSPGGPGLGREQGTAAGGRVAVPSRQLLQDAPATRAPAKHSFYSPGLASFDCRSKLVPDFWACTPIMKSGCPPVHPQGTPDREMLWECCSAQKCAASFCTNPQPKCPLPFSLSISF